MTGASTRHTRSDKCHRGSRGQKAGKLLFYEEANFLTLRQTTITQTMMDISHKLCRTQTGESIIKRQN